MIVQMQLKWKEKKAVLTNVFYFRAAIISQSK